MPAAAAVAHRVVFGPKALDDLRSLYERDAIRPGLRTAGYGRRVTGAFQVTVTDVIILRALYGGRDVEALLRDGDDG
jgi:plasmid stabilization system protein ParE